MKNDQDKTREEFILELNELRKEFNSRDESRESDMLKLIHELEVHQIELEMQNEELSTIREEAEISSNQYTELYDFAPSGYVTLTKDGKIRKINHAAALMIGHERGNLLNNKLSSFLSKKTSATFDLFFQKVFNLKTKQSCEVALVNRDQLPVYIHIDGIVLENEELCLTSMIDISSLMLSREELKQSDERYASLFEENHSVMLLVEPETGEIRDANPAASLYYGWTHAELCSKNISEINTLSRAEVVVEMQKAKEAKRQQFLFQHRLANGESRNVEVYSGPIKFNNITLLYSLVHDITDRVNAENAFRESEEKFSKAFQTSPYAIIITRAEDGKVIEINDAIETITGYSRDELIDDSTVNLKLWVDIEQRNKIVAELNQGKIIFGKECLFRKKSGVILTGLFSAQIIYLKNKPFIFSSINDISERKKAEEMLLENESLLNSIVETAKDSIFIKDRSLRYIKVNAAMEALFEMSREAMIGKSDSDLFGIENSGHIEEIDRQVLLGETIEEFPSKPVNGEMHHFHTIKVPLRDVLGEINGLCGIARDITERKKAEDALLKSEKLYRSILHASPDDITITDLEGEILMVSPVGVKMFGFETEEEIIGTNIATFIVPEERERAFINIDSMFKGVVAVQGEYQGLRKDGSIFDIDVKGEFIRDSDGMPVKMIFVVRDISERKQTLLQLEKSEEALYKLNMELEQRVNVRTTQLTIANKDLESFAYSVSHDLRSPLRHITGFVEMLKEIKKVERTKEEVKYLDIIGNGAKEMDQLIEALLSFSRLGRTELQKSKINISKLVKQVIQFFEPEFQNRKIIFNIGDLPQAMGDEKLIKQVWINLISNAIKYTGKKVEANIEIDSIDKENETLYFIKDNGAGFDKRYADKLFGVFQRLHRARDFEGIGIGLANMSRIVNRHGGHCSAEGEINQGATFYFTLPK